MARKNRSFKIETGKNQSRYDARNYSTSIVPTDERRAKAQAILDNYSRYNSEKYSHKRAKKSGRGGKIAVAVLLFLLILIGAGGFGAWTFINSINDNLQSGYTEQERMAIQEKMVESSFDEVFYVLLVGSDSRDMSDLAGSRTDTNIIVRVDPINDQLSMLSIPRDTKISIPGYGTNKFNAAYAYGGLGGVLDAVYDLTGIQISHYAEISMQGVIDLVDALGGVEVDCPMDLGDPHGGAFIPAGVSTLDGEHALIFARSRYDFADGDFTRTSNQRMVVTSLIKKVLNMPVNEIPGVITKGAKCVNTDLSVFDIYSLAVQFKNLGDLTVYSCMMPAYTDMIDGISYVICDYSTFDRMLEIFKDGGDPSTVDNYNGSAIGSMYNDY